MMENPLIRMKHMITQTISNCSNEQASLAFWHGGIVGINEA